MDPTEYQKNFGKSLQSSIEYSTVLCCDL